MTKKKKRPQKLTLSRWLISFAVALLFYFFYEKPTIGSIEEGNPPSFYCNQCHDDLEQTYLKAIAEAQNSIYLVIYTFTDKKLIEALNKRASEGIAVTLFHDPTTSEKPLSPLIKAHEVASKGLMHQKILVVDEKNVWIGSANFTKESLKVHDNMVVGVSSSKLAERIIHQTPQHYFTIGGQNLEFWTFPEEGKEGLERLITLLDSAKKTVRVAMFTWTHPKLTDAAIRAKLRGVSVEIVMDHGQGIGVNAKALEMLQRSNLNVALSSSQMLHHKFVWIDDTLLAIGSANWTKAAFLKNEDCLLIIHDLTEDQKIKMDKIWHRVSSMVRSTSNRAKLFPAPLACFFIRTQKLAYC